MEWARSTLSPTEWNEPWDRARAVALWGPLTVSGNKLVKEALPRWRVPPSHTFSFVFQPLLVWTQGSWKLRNTYRVWTEKVPSLFLVWGPQSERVRGTPPLLCVCCSFLPLCGDSGSMTPDFSHRNHEGQGQWNICKLLKKKKKKELLT